jgi:CrcB protein
MNFLIVGLGGFFGAISRYAIYLFEGRFNNIFPFATLFINTLGCLATGVLMGWAVKTNPQFRQFIILGSIGFIGSFTTYSTFSAETIQLVRANQMLYAFSNVALNLVLGFTAIWIGLKFIESN